jgi:hypothetical protein
MTFDGSNLEIVANGLTVSSGSATFSGALSAATGTFSGALSAATGSFAGSLSAASGTFAGTLTAGAVNAVNTINIADDAVTVPVSSEFVNLGGTPAPSFGLGLASANFGGGKVFISACTGIFKYESGGSAESVYIALYRDGSYIKESGRMLILNDQTLTLVWNFEDVPSVGSHSYSIRVVASSNVAVTRATLIARGTKK